MGAARVGDEHLGGPVADDVFERGAHDLVGGLLGPGHLEAALDTGLEVAAVDLTLLVPLQLPGPPLLVELRHAASVPVIPSPRATAIATRMRQLASERLELRLRLSIGRVDLLLVEAPERFDVRCVESPAARSRSVAAANSSG